ncbi:uncharacterized protein K441DRAFT_74902, partial [Cenococcum geophilum 1.58]|uniref:uncharacterized protein n=1 Tax=Cenococcum geophilum 1.58 TaxID=794803 RepID=UPI00358F64A3
NNLITSRNKLNTLPSLFLFHPIKNHNQSLNLLPPYLPLQNPPHMSPLPSSITSQPTSSPDSPPPSQ